MVVEALGGKLVSNLTWIAFNRERFQCIKRLVPWRPGHERGMIYHRALESWQNKDHIAHSKAMWHHIFRKRLSIQIYVFTLLRRSPSSQA